MCARIRNLNDLLGRLKGVKKVGDNEYLALCPGHHDSKPSLSVKVVDGKILVHCFAGCELDDILKKLGLEPKDLFLDKRKTKEHEKKIEAIYSYNDANGKPFEVVRTRPKGFYQRRPDGKGGYINNLEGIVPTLYHQEKVRQAIENTMPIYFVEGEKDADRLWNLGLVATTNPMGAGKWHNNYTEALRGADLIIIPDNDKPGHDHANQVARSTYGIAKRIRVLELPGNIKDISDWVDKGGSTEQLQQLVSTCPEYKPAQLDEIVNRCRYYMFMPDTGPLEVLLGAVAANLLPGDPVWLLLIGPPGWGKTELLNCLTQVQDIHPIAVLTEASLLSGTPRRDSQDAKGGLLREIGGFGILLVKDFGGVLSLTRETRGPILAAFREIYDGSWTRYVGSDGGRMLMWTGKAGLVGGATPSIDRQYAVMATLGERFCYYRMPEVDEVSRAGVALAHAGHETEMRNELAKLVADFFGNLKVSSPIELSLAERDKLIALAVFTTRCRSAIERDSYQSREIQLIPGVESPTRLVKVLSQLLCGLQLIGVTKERAWELITKVALDSMPALRQHVVMAMFEDDAQETTTSDLANKLGYPTNTTRRTLEDLACYDIVKRQSQGEGRSDIWSLTNWARNTYGAASRTLPEIREGVSTALPLVNQTDNLEFSISGKVGDDNTPGRPTHPCRNCGCSEYWLTDWNQWLCSRCHPKPQRDAGQ